VKSVAAMTALGGTIIVGVDGRGKPTGLVSPQLAAVYDDSPLRDILEPFLSADIAVHTQTHPVDGSLVIVVYVPPGVAGPLPLIAEGVYTDKQRKEKFLFRRGDRYIRDGTKIKLWVGDVHQVALLVTEHATTSRSKPLTTRADGLSLEEAIDRYLAAMRRDERKESTIRDYGRLLRRLAREHPGFMLSDFEPPDGRDRLERFIERGWSDRASGTRGTVISTYRSFFRWSDDKDLLSSNPLSRLQRPKERSPRRKTANAKEVERLIEAQPRLQDRVGIQLLARVGLHKRELRQLRWSAVDLQNAEIRVRGRAEGDLPIRDEGLIADLNEL
jgi:hypothetical protein